MPAQGNAPELRGTFGDPNHITHAAMGDVVLGDIQQLRQSGQWLDGELHVVRHPLGSAVLYGDCLASGQAVEAALDTALTTDNPKALTELPGSYTTLLFEPHRLTALGDLANQYPLYYRPNDQGMAYSSATQPLRNTMAAPQLDRLAAAARLALPLPTDLVAGRSATEGINRLDGGHILTVDRAGGKAATKPYETFESPDIKTIDDAAAVLREAMQEAARLRAASRYNLSADFSGGLDSTTAAYLLARETSQPLPITTIHTADMPSADLDQARRLLALPASQGLFRASEYAENPQDGIYDGMLDAPQDDEPDTALLSYQNEQSYYQFLADQGSEVHANGSAADCLLDANATLYLGEWARPGSYARFVRGTAEVARLAKASPITIAKQARLRSKLTPAKDLDAIARLLQGSADPAALMQGGWLFGTEAAPQWLTPTMRKELSELAAARADAMRHEPQLPYGNHRAYASLRNMGHDQVGSMRRAADWGLRQRAVYMDHPVIRACLSIPASMRMNPWTFKAILVKATEGLIPPEVTQRGTKGDYTPQAAYGIRRALPDLQILLRHSRLADMGIIDPAAVQKTLDRIPISTTLPWQSLETFAATELWLGNTIPGASSPPPASVLAPKTPESKAETVAAIADETILSMPADALLVTFPNGGASLRLANNAYYRHNSFTVQLVEALRQSSSFGAVIARYIADNPAVPPEAIRTMVTAEVRKLIHIGVLVEGKGAFSITEATANRMPSAAPMTRQNQESAKARRRDYPVALGSFVLAMALKRLPVGAQICTLERIHRRWATQPASEAQAKNILAAVQGIAELHPARAACFEVTAATALAAALQKKRINLTLGVSSDLSLFHAWPAVAGTAIRTARDPEIEGIFEPLLSA